MAHSVNRIGISGVGLYRPNFGLEEQLAAAIAADPTLRFGAPDEDALTMAWECLSRLNVPSEADTVILASPLDGLEPRSFVAHLHETGALPSRTQAVAVHGAADVADVLGLGTRLGHGSVAVLVDRDRPSDPLQSPTGDCAVAVAFGEPLVAEIGPHVAIAALSFDRWHEADERADRDARFVEDRLLAHEAKEVVDLLHLQVETALGEFLGVVVTAPVQLKVGRLAQQWGVPKVTLPSVAATEPGELRAGALLSALTELAAAGPGSCIALVNVGWGASGVLLTAGPEIARALADTGGGTTAVAHEPSAYGFRSWLVSHRPPYVVNPWTSGSELSREAAGLLGLVGSECAACSAIAFPSAQVCEHCGSFETTPHPLVRAGTAITHSIDELYGAPDTTVQMVVVGLDGGGQFYGQAVQGLSPWLEVGERCRLLLRRLHTGSGLPHYYWKVDRHD